MEECVSFVYISAMVMVCYLTGLSSTENGFFSSNDMKTLNSGWFSKKEDFLVIIISLMYKNFSIPILKKNSHIQPIICHCQIIKFSEKHKIILNFKKFWLSNIIKANEKQS